MRAMDCDCGHHLEAEDDQQLAAAAQAHVAQRHPELQMSEDDLRALIAAKAYDA